MRWFFSSLPGILVAISNDGCFASGFRAFGASSIFLSEIFILLILMTLCSSENVIFLISSFECFPVFFFWSLAKFVLIELKANCQKEIFSWCDQTVLFP